VIDIINLPDKMVAAQHNLFHEEAHGFSLSGAATKSANLTTLFPRFIRYTPYPWIPYVPRRRKIKIKNRAIVNVF